MVQPLPDFITHYYEADKGPFRNICDLSDLGIEMVIQVEKEAKTAFNRFAEGADFFRVRRAADDLLIAKYTERFNHAPKIRPYFAVSFTREFILNAMDGDPATLLYLGLRGIELEDIRYCAPCGPRTDALRRSPVSFRP
jgi:hypothetical protein